MTNCLRLKLGLPPNCALCEFQNPDTYAQCNGIKPKTAPEPKIVIQKVRKLSYEESMVEVQKYIQSRGGKIPISEIAEKLGLDMDMVIKILEE